jgi:hypothetical protein
MKVGQISLEDIVNHNLPNLSYECPKHTPCIHANLLSFHSYQLGPCLQACSRSNMEHGSEDSVQLVIHCDKD